MSGPHERLAAVLADRYGIEREFGAANVRGWMQMNAGAPCE